MLLESPVCPFAKLTPRLPQVSVVACLRSLVFIGCTLGIKGKDTVNVAGRFWFQRGVLFL
jgi:hypothetical protein